MLMDLRIAVRSVRREPGFAAIAILALGLGIGLPASMISLTRGLAFRGLPVDNGREIMYLERHPRDRSGEGWGVAPKDFVVWREQQHSFNQLGSFASGTVAFRIDRGAWRYNAAWVSANTFDILREHAAVGRALQPGDDEAGSAPVVVLGHTVWRDRFDSDDAAVGRTVFIDGEARTVVGVMPEGFRFPSNEDLWLPKILPADATTASGPTFAVFGRVAPGTNIDRARADFDVIARRTEQLFPETNRNMGISVKPYTEHMVGETPVATMRVLLGAVMLVLLVACTNVANLLLVRAINRVRELAVRSALGAGRLRIALQMVAESSVLALLGGGLGVLIAIGASALLARMLGTGRLPYWADIRVDGTTLLFMVGLSVFAALIAGVLPAIRAMRADVGSIIKDQSRGSTGLRTNRVMQALIVIEIAVSLGLIVNTGLIMRSVRNVQKVSLGFPVERITTASVTLPDTWDASTTEQFLAGIERGIAARPAARRITVASSLPATRASTTRFGVEGATYAEDTDMPFARIADISNGFFDVFDTAPVTGRVFGPQDIEGGQPVAIVNQRFVDRFLAGRDPLGARIRAGNSSSDQPWLTIVGVVPNLWAGGLDASGDRNPAAFYRPVAQAAPQSVSIAVESTGDPATTASAIRATVAELDPDVPVYDVKSMHAVIVDNSWFYGFLLAVVAACGIVALILAAVGLYGVIAFSVGRRLREFGIRLALGATPNSIRGLVLRKGSLQMVVGLAAGFGLAALIASGLTSLLFNVSPKDPFVYAVAGALLLGIAQLATAVPAIRASGVDPLTALRSE
jgi:putative ABC transport system permease protein